jgi:hypothetical protein
VPEQTGGRRGGPEIPDLDIRELLSDDLDAPQVAEAEVSGMGFGC